jgi:prepilin-type N-terminal cleavage/methylation domain-containing protein
VRTKRGQGGFTILEMLIVVAIIGILSSLATVGYRRYVGRARLTEGVTILSEMSSKQQIYYLEFGSYLPLRADGSVVPSPDENASGFYPVSPSSTTFDSVRSPTSIADPLGWPTAWRSVGLRPREQRLYCTYLLNAGRAASPAPAGATYGPTLLGTISATSPPWFYALAACNLNGVSGWPTSVTVMGLSSNASSLRTFNDGQ